MHDQGSEDSCIDQIKAEECVESVDQNHSEVRVPCFSSGSST